jgi:hypothetical protein|eukprot:COSAG01_NODE_22034_length_874_cov_52.912258_1_plen_169_part_00
MRVFDLGIARASDFLPLAEVPAISALVFRDGQQQHQHQRPGLADRQVAERALLLSDRAAAAHTGRVTPAADTKAAAARSDDAAKAASGGQPGGQSRAPRRTAARQKAVRSNDPAPAFYREAVVAVYSAHAPHMLSKVDTVLAKWQGREQALLQRLHRKYGRTMARPTH